MRFNDETTTYTYNQEIKRKTRRSKKGKEKRKNNINIIYCNINGVRGKIESLQEVITMEKADIILLTETKGAPPKIAGMTWFHRQRKNGKGGGVAIGMNNNIAKYSKIITPNEDSDQEIIWVSTETPNRKKTIFGCFYGPQEKTKIEEVKTQYDHLTTQIEMLNVEGTVILGGDFNAKLPVKTEDYNQEISRNGKLLEEMLNETGMTPVNGKSTTGKWTRVNRNNTAEKSIIDYILIHNNNMELVKKVEIDEKGTLRLKNKGKESDHNTITVQIEIPRQKEERKIQKWDITENTNWEEVNKHIEEYLERKEGHAYKDLESAIKESLAKKIGKKTITIKDNNRKRETKEIKDLRKAKKEQRRKFETANKEDKPRELQEYYTTQIKLRKAIGELEKSRITQIMENISKSKDKNEIWKVRKRLMGKSNEDFDTITEEDQLLTSSEETKEYIAAYYEDLYQAREETEEGKTWTNMIKEENRKTEIKVRNTHTKDISTREMIKAQKKLRKKKSCGPDGIPNEVLINASNKILEHTRRSFNEVSTKQEIPKPWKEGRIVRIYKGKGTKGKCSSERGITVSSNVGKLYERIINERTKETVKISEMQGGGKPGANTADHLLVLQETLRNQKEAYIAFLDVTKAYDKAWADGIMYVLAKQGVYNKTWTTIRKLNEGLTAVAETKYGHTREIKMKDNIRQGGVLSVIMYAVLMDEIAKEIKERNIGIETTENNKIGCLLWMDDVALIADNPTELQEMLNITNEIGKKYRIKFGEEKSKIMKIGNKAKKYTGSFKLGEMTLEECTQYKYLGVILSENRNLEKHLHDTKRKVEAAFNTIMAIAGSTDLKNVELKTIWTTLEACIIPIMTYGMEACIPNKKEKATIKQTMDNLLKRIIMTPRSTPWEPLYIETGLLDIESTIMYNKYTYREKINRGKNKLLKSVTHMKDKKGWEETTKEELANLMGPGWKAPESANKTKRMIKSALKEKLLKTIKENGNQKSKTLYYLNNKKEIIAGKRAQYMDILSRKEASTIFAARTRMIDVKTNYRNKYKDTKCRMCKTEEETQKHVLENCMEINRNEIGQITEEDIFTEETGKLKTTAWKINRIKELLSAAPL